MLDKSFRAFITLSLVLFDDDDSDDAVLGVAAIIVEASEVDVGVTGEDDDVDDVLESFHSPSVEPLEREEVRREATPPLT